MSRPARVMLMMVLAFALTLTAGAVVGFVYARQPGVSNGDPGKTTTVSQPPVSKPVPTQPAARDGMTWLSEQLSLDASQRDQIRAIWAEVPHDKLRQLDERRRNLFREQYDAIMAIYTPTQRSERDRIRSEYEAKTRELYKERDQAIEALYSDEQKAKRDQISKDYTAKSTEVNKERDRLLQATGDRIKALLSEEQRKKYEAITSRGWGGDRHRGGPRPGSQPSTRPSGEPHRSADQRGPGGPGGPPPTGRPPGPPPMP